tara:strand:+ start:174 stop:383 length:210 start_codon:yes stop_codon:yes gene_type:complete
MGGGQAFRNVVLRQRMDPSGRREPEQEELALLLPSVFLVYANRKYGMDSGQYRWGPADRQEGEADWTHE